VSSESVRYKASYLPSLRKYPLLPSDYEEISLVSRLSRTATMEQSLVFDHHVLASSARGTDDDFCEPSGGNNWSFEWDW
jgi:hypothetical protein